MDKYKVEQTLLVVVCLTPRRFKRVVAGLMAGVDLAGMCMSWSDLVALIVGSG